MIAVRIKLTIQTLFRTFHSPEDMILVAYSSFTLLWTLGGGYHEICKNKVCANLDLSIKFLFYLNEIMMTLQTVKDYTRKPLCFISLAWKINSTPCIHINLSLIYIRYLFLLLYIFYKILMVWSSTRKLDTR